MGKKLELTGQRFGRLRVTEFAGWGNRGESKWICDCRCRGEIIVRGQDLMSRNTQSCGCLKSEMLKARKGKNNPMYGKHFSEEAKERHSKIFKNRQFSEEWRRKLSEAQTGKKYTKEDREKMSKAHIGLNINEKNGMYGKKGKDAPGYKHGLYGTKEYRQNKCAEYRARRKNHTPVNADRKKIQEIYSYCAKLNKESFFNYEIDHIQPISKGGLHHQNNLQILKAELNSEKHNKWPLNQEEQIKYAGIILKN